jgi:acetyl esterase/lipase
VSVTRTRHRYGPARPQVADLWRPGDAAGDLPVVVLLHGGFWRGPYTKRLMRRLAAAVALRGWAAFNVEYRRVGPVGGGGGWPTTFEDVAAAIDHLGTVDGLDTGRVVTCGHSAGGHLALWAAGRGRLPAGAPGARPIGVRVTGAVSLAGMPDLVRAAELGLGGGAAAALLGGTPDQVAERYRVASPAALLPLGVPQVLVHGLHDAVVPAALSAAYQQRASAAGDDAVFEPVTGAGHMALIEPSGGTWALVASQLARLLG